MSWIERLKTKWQIESNRDFCLIILTFSLAGMTIMPVRKFIFHAVGITHSTPLWIKILLYIPLIPPAYYVGLLIFGALLGQWAFFRNFLLARLRFLRGRKNV